jgi:hypothetical protein
MNTTSEPWWPWVTDVIIPSAGVLASTAVAVVAIVLATRDRRADRAEIAEARRVEFAERLRQWIVARSTLGVVVPPADISRIRTMAAQMRPRATPIIDWATIEVDNAWQPIKVTSESRIKIMAPHPDIQTRAHERINRWERGEPFDFSPLRLPPIDEP